MTTLRALVGACFLLGVMGFVVSVPLGWAIVLGIGAAYPEKLIKGRPNQRNDALVQKKILHVEIRKRVLLSSPSQIDIVPHFLCRQQSEEGSLIWILRQIQGNQRLPSLPLGLTRMLQ